MVFPNNRLIMEHVGGPSFEFNPLDALKMVDAHHESVQVAAAKEWRATRSCLALRCIITMPSWFNYLGSNLCIV